MPQQNSPAAPSFRHQPKAHIQPVFRGCFLGGAVGDALGAPVEFMSRAEILKHFGEQGICDYVPAYGRLGAITDDTQMALFTAEGILRAFVRGKLKGICHPASVIAYSYLRWLHTQGLTAPAMRLSHSGWLIEHPELFSQRAPGVTCLSALQAMTDIGNGSDNDSKGCGGVMRVAPIGMMFAGMALRNPARREEHLLQAFVLATTAAGITHGHVTGQLAAGAFAAIVFLLLEGKPLREAIAETLQILAHKPGHEETTAAIQKAVELSTESQASVDALVSLGEGWIAEEALAIGLYAALCAKDFESGVIMAVNHDGDSDSTGLIAGHLLGAIHGVESIPDRWQAELELRKVIEEISDDLASFEDWKLGEDDEVGDESNYYRQRYPGG